MAAVAEAKIREELSKRKTRSIYVFVSSDPFKLDYYAQKVCEVAEIGRPEIMYADDIEFGPWLDDLKTVSLFSSGKVVLVRHGERWSAKDWENLVPLVKDGLEGTILMVQSMKSDSRWKFFQALQKSESSVWVKLEDAVGGEWNLWLQSFLREAGKDLEDQARLLLQRWIGSSLSELRMTVHRAALHAGHQPLIREQDVRAVATKTTQEDIFLLIEKLFSFDGAASLNLAKCLLEQGEEPIAMVGLLTRQYRWLLSIVAGRAEGKSDAQIATSCGIFPAAGRVLFPVARRLGGKGVVRGLGYLATADHALKSSRAPKEDIFYQLLLDLVPSTRP